MFKKVNRYKFRGEHMSPLHTMVNALCRKNEVIVAKRLLHQSPHMVQ